MKRIIFSTALCFGTLLGFAQQDPQFTLNTFDKLSVNPGSAGLDDAICGSLIHRQQWIGFGGSPKTTLFNVQSPVNLLRGGVGLTVYSDKLGQETNTLVRGAYSYHLGIGSLPGTLGIGISGGIVNKTLGADWVATDGFILDNAIPDAGVTNTVFDMAFGLYYKASNMYIGLSTTHITQSSLEDLNLDLSRHYYLQAGYTYTLNSNIDLLPSVFVKTDAASTQIDINAIAMYNKQFFGGVTYRTADAISPIIGYQMAGLGEKGNQSVKIGLAYDITTSLLKDHSSNTFEVGVHYCYKLDKPDKLQKYKNVRFL